MSCVWCIILIPAKSFQEIYRMKGCSEDEIYTYTYIVICIIISMNFTYTKQFMYIYMIDQMFRYFHKSIGVQFLS